MTAPENANENARRDRVKGAGAVKALHEPARAESQPLLQPYRTGD